MSRKYVINALIYILATLGANYTAAWFIPFPIFGQVAVGTFIFGITFTQRDKLHGAGGSGSMARSRSRPSPMCS
jgi:uncharacterized PurR-regulated membrane protein YhhQ (DUF165 family)